MTGAEFRDQLKRYSLSQTAAAAFFGVTDRTVRNWVTEGRPPVAVIVCLDLLAEFDSVTARELIFKIMEEEKQRLARVTKEIIA
jgi:hypothetical protein